MTNKKKFLNLVSAKDTTILKEIKWRSDNRAMLHESKNIAFKVLLKLKDLNWTQRDLAKAMKVTPQHINKIVSGKENLTIQTQLALQEVLNIPILASYYEKENTELEHLDGFTESLKIAISDDKEETTNYPVVKESGGVLKMEYNKDWDFYTVKKKAS